MRLGDVCEVVHGKNQHSVESDVGIYPIYGSGGRMGYATAYLCPADTVVVGRKGTINRPLFVREPLWNVDTAFGLVADRDVLLPEFLYHFCLQFDFSRLNRAATIPSLTKKSISEIEMSLPSVVGQQEVVTRLQVIESLEGSLRRQLSLLDELVKSRFVEMFGDGGSFCQLPLSACVGAIDSGKSPKCAPGPRKGTRPGVLKLSGISSGVYLECENKALPSEDSFLATKEVVEGDILLARKNTPELVGRCALVHETAGHIMFPDIVFRMHPIDDVDGTYLSHLLGGPYFDKVRSLAHGSAKSMSNIPKSELARLCVPIPPLSLQREFAAFAAEVAKSQFVGRMARDCLNCYVRAMRLTAERGRCPCFSSNRLK